MFDMITAPYDVKATLPQSVMSAAVACKSVNQAARAFAQVVEPAQKVMQSYAAVTASAEWMKPIVSQYASFKAVWDEYNSYGYGAQNRVERRHRLRFLRFLEPLLSDDDDKDKLVQAINQARDMFYRWVSTRLGTSANRVERRHGFDDRTEEQRWREEYRKTELYGLQTKIEPAITLMRLIESTALEPRAPQHTPASGPLSTGSRVTGRNID